MTTIQRRIEALYRAANRSETAHGAGTWMARQLGVDPNTVYRWIKGEREPGGPTLRAIELLEERYDVGEEAAQ